jgi:Bacterial HORMA domain family 1
MTDTYSDTFNREDIRRVHASFAADYRIAAESTELHSRSFVDATISEIGALAEEQYLSKIHLRLLSSGGAVREAAVYTVSTDAGSWAAERPGDMYWKASHGDRLCIDVFYSATWRALTRAQKDAFIAKYLASWGTSDFDGNYDGLVGSMDRQYSSRAYGMDRTRYSGTA